MKKKAEQMEEQEETPKAYRVLVGCDTADGTRYEAGDDYFPGNHAQRTTAALLEMDCLEEVE